MSVFGVKTVAITGITGYLGHLLRNRLVSDGIPVIGLCRYSSDLSSRRYVMGEIPSQGLLSGVDVLVHCAYDMSVRSQSDIWKINVEGTHRLLRLAQESNVRRTIVLSSMSAFDGTNQLYGRSKLAIEDFAREMGAISVRPGLVYGPKARGMAGSLSALTRLPLVPVPASRSYQFAVHEDDFVQALSALINSELGSTDPIGLANPVAVRFKDLVEGLARLNGRTCRIVPLNWRILLSSLRACEKVGIELPFAQIHFLVSPIPPPMFRIPCSGKPWGFSSEDLVTLLSGCLRAHGGTKGDGAEPSPF